jgi:hypothetical protein
MHDEPKLVSGPAGAPPTEGEEATTLPDAAPPADAAVDRTAGRRRLLAAAVTLPWLIGYGVIGSWAVTRGARAAAGGLPSIDVGYSGMVSPAGVIVVGALLLAGFAALLATAMLVLHDARGRGPWATVCAVSAFLTAGSVWAAASGGLKPGLWFLFFGGLLYALALSLSRVRRVTRAAARGRIARP